MEERGTGKIDKRTVSNEEISEHLDLIMKKILHLGKLDEAACDQLVKDFTIIHDAIEAFAARVDKAKKGMSNDKKKDLIENTIPHLRVEALRLFEKFQETVDLYPHLKDRYDDINPFGTDLLLYKNNAHDQEMLASDDVSYAGRETETSTKRAEIHWKIEVAQNLVDGLIADPDYQAIKSGKSERLSQQKKLAILGKIFVAYNAINRLEEGNRTQKLRDVLPILNDILEDDNNMVG